MAGKRSWMPLKIVFGVWGGSGVSCSASILRFGLEKLKVRGAEWLTQGTAPPHHSNSRSEVTSCGIQTVYNKEEV